MRKKNLAVFAAFITGLGLLVSPLRASATMFTRSMRASGRILRKTDAHEMHAILLLSIM